MQVFAGTREQVFEDFVRRYNDRIWKIANSLSSLTKGRLESDDTYQDLIFEIYETCMDESFEPSQSKVTFLFQRLHWRATHMLNRAFRKGREKECCAEWSEESDSDVGVSYNEVVSLEDQSDEYAVFQSPYMQPDRLYDSIEALRRIEVNIARVKNEELKEMIQLLIDPSEEFLANSRLRSLYKEKESKKTCENKGYETGSMLEMYEYVGLGECKGSNVLKAAVEFVKSSAAGETPEYIACLDRAAEEEEQKRDKRLAYLARFDHMYEKDDAKQG